MTRTRRRVKRSRPSQTGTPPTPSRPPTPVVLTSLTAEDSLLREEIFGPVAPIEVWRDVDELLAKVDETKSGLAAYVFGGVKQSGIGREGARAGLEEYLETQYLSVAGSGASAV